jgi:hypothetical protein
MTLSGKTNEKRLQRRLILASLVLVLTFLSHSLAVASTGHSFHAAVSTYSLASHSGSAEHSDTRDAPERPCDADYNASLTPGQNRPELLATTDANGWYPATSVTTGPAEPESAPAVSAVLLRTLLQVFLI